MTIPLLGFVPGWIIFVAALLILMFYFGKKVLHIIATIFLVWLVWYLFHRFF